jgi:hypothetical protein
VAVGNLAFVKAQHYISEMSQNCCRFFDWTAGLDPFPPPEQKKLKINCGIKIKIKIKMFQNILKSAWLALPLPQMP